MRHYWVIVLLLIVFTSLKTWAIPEREPILVAQSGFMLEDAAQMARFCPKCIYNNNNSNNNASLSCCLSRLLDKYSCVEGRGELENPVCMASGAYCSTNFANIPSNSLSPIRFPNQTSYLCLMHYFLFTTCDNVFGELPRFFANAGFSFCPTAPYAIKYGRCLRNNVFPSCDLAPPALTGDFVILALFIAHQAIAGVLFLARSHVQPLKARNRFITVLSYLWGTVFGILLVIPNIACPVYVFVFLVGGPLFFSSYLSRAIYLYGTWQYNRLKHRFLFLFNRSRGNNNDDNDDNNNSNFGFDNNENQEQATMLLKQTTLQLSIFKKLSSYLASFAVMLLMLIICCVAYIIIMATHGRVNDQYPLYWRADGCLIDFATAITFVGIILFQYVLLLVLVLLMRSIRDIYGLWLSGLADMLLGLFFIVLALAVGAALVNSESISFITPYTILTIWVWCTSAVNITIPAIFTFFWQRQACCGKRASATPDAQVAKLHNVKTFLNSKKLMPAFLRFCQKEFSMENPLFWVEVEKYKKQQNAEKRKKSAQEIFDSFIAAGGFLELNIDSKKRTSIERVLQDAPADLFTTLQEEIEVVMNDTFARFETSAEFVDIESKAKEDAGFWKSAGLE